MRGVEVVDSICSIAQVGKRLPGLISFRPTLPMNKILQLVFLVLGVNNVVDFIFLFAILCNIGGTWGSHRLTWQVFMTWLYSGDVDDGVNAHRVGKVELDSISPD